MGDGGGLINNDTTAILRNPRLATRTIGIEYMQCCTLPSLINNFNIFNPSFTYRRG